MILNFDVKGLEVVCAAYLSKDPVLYQELNDNIDIHSMNQSDLKLPDRGVAKKFKFRTIYGGMFFHNDPDFSSVSTSRKFWDGVLDRYFEKYNGMYKWHNKLIREVGATGIYISPTGRSFKFEMKKGYRGDMELPTTQIKNYPVQSLGADIMSVLRVDFHRRFKNANIKGLLVNTVHDSIVLDLESNLDVDKVVELIYNVLLDFPRNFEKIFGVPFDLEIRGEIEVGDNMLEMHSI